MPSAARSRLSSARSSSSSRRWWCWRLARWRRSSRPTSRPRGSSTEEVERFLDSEHITELLDHVLERRAVLVVGEGGGAVGEHDYLVIEHHRVARGAFAADVGFGAGDEQGVDAPLPQRLFEITLDEGAVAALGD